jgi:hypothetical protein
MSEPHTTPSPVVLADSERKFLVRLRGEEQSRFHALLWFILGAILVWLGWDAPFALGRFCDLPYSQSKELPYGPIGGIHLWFVGVGYLLLAIHSTFFDRKRRLLVKLAAYFESLNDRDP